MAIQALSHPKITSSVIQYASILTLLYLCGGCTEVRTMQPDEWAANKEFLADQPFLPFKRK